jgi:hypothetical protein
MKLLIIDPHRCASALLVLEPYEPCGFGAFSSFLLSFSLAVRVGLSDVPAKFNHKIYLYVVI